MTFKMLRELSSWRPKLDLGTVLQVPHLAMPWHTISATHPTGIRTKSPTALAAEMGTSVFFEVGN